MRLGIFIFITLFLTACGDNTGGNTNPVANVQLNSFSADYDRSANTLKIGVGLVDVQPNSANGEWFLVEGPLEHGATLLPKFPRRDSGTVSVQKLEMPEVRITCTAIRCTAFSLTVRGYKLELPGEIRALVHAVKGFGISNDSSLPFPTPLSPEEAFVHFLDSTPSGFNSSVVETVNVGFKYVTLHAQGGKSTLVLSNLADSPRLDLEHKTEFSSIVIGRVLGKFEIGTLGDYSWSIAGRSLSALLDNSLE